MKRVAWDALENLARCVAVDPDAQPRVVLRPGLSDHPLREFPLVHEDGAIERLVEEAERQRGRDSVRKVRCKDVECRPLDSYRVSFDQIDLREGSAKIRREPTIRLHGDHPLRALRELSREDPQPRPNLEHDIGRPEVRVVDVTHGHPRVDEEVLAHALPGTYAEVGEDTAWIVFHDRRTAPSGFRLAAGPRFLRRRSPWPCMRASCRWWSDRSALHRE